MTAPATARFRARCRKIKEKSQVRRKTAESPGFYCFDAIAGHAFSARLISVSRICKSIGKNPDAGSDRRTNDAFDMFGASSKKKQSLGIEAHVVPEQHRSDFFSERRAARLARSQRLDAARLEPCLERIHARSLSRTVDAFKR